MTDFNNYFSYLQNRSQLGLVYRKWLLYPKLNKFLPGKVLDIGSGIGDFLRYRADATGIDINPKLVDWCKSSGLNVMHMKTDQLPFENEVFDSILLDNVLEHIENPEPLLIEINRTLLINGSLVVGVPGIAGYKSDLDHKTYYSRSNLVETIEKYGFENTKVFVMPVNISWLEDRLTQYCIYGVFKKVSM